MAELIIKRAKLCSVKEIIDVQKLAFHSEAEIHQNFTIRPLVQTIESVAEDFSSYHFYIALISGTIVGSVKIWLMEDNILHIGRLVVHPAHQGRGIGKKLMQYVENEYRDAKSFQLFTAEKSHRNIGFYENMGYEMSGKYTEPGHSDIHLVRFIKINPAIP